MKIFKPRITWRGIAATKKIFEPPWRQDRQEENLESSRVVESQAANRIDFGFLISAFAGTSFKFWIGRDTIQIIYEESFFLS